MREQAASKGKMPFWRGKAGTIAFLLGVACIGFLAQFQVIGAVGITIYGIVMLSRRLPARVTFVAALLTLVMVVIAILVGNWLVAQNFAAYTFLLLVLGVVALTADLQREIHPKK